jgi:putative transposase
MPRQARLDTPGVLQHVMARGIERRKIFWDDKDRASFLKRMAQIFEETQTQCYAWALIPNHFHILLRTGPTPLSNVMRRLMTGYAVTFNHRHKRAGHLFQNRYKSVVCEEDPYLLELVRYIHLNPMRAKIIEDLKTLDKYPWTGHSVLLGNNKNPLIPEISPVIEEDTFLAEKTVEDVLQYFGNNLREARRRYRAFVEKGIKHGRREDLQGGGLVRSAGGYASVLSSHRKNQRELADERILGSGDFVASVLKDQNELAEKRLKQKIPLDEMIQQVSEFLGIEKGHVLSRSRKRIIAKARALIAYYSVHKMGYKSVEVSRVLMITGPSVSKCIERGKNLVDTAPEMYQKLIN